MAKGYEDISRRGLIKLGHDFDRENDAALLRYLAEHPDYENIRAVEKITVKVDNLVDTVKSSGGIFKAVAAREAAAASTKAIEAVIGVVGCAADEAEIGLTSLKNKVQNV